ncbi:hypothetical protein SAMN05421647_102329 [Marinobacterium stanieri]|uniref:Uncharacterized protein n=1 Tax=Marinobacterium stanieri TaxID=49186 RepID=A0A1N6Q8D4_9GAMM|nr:hypothetical protein SAMN05421647_102329 [Marinobacterium stanieri]
MASQATLSAIGLLTAFLAEVEAKLLFAHLLTTKAALTLFATDVAQTFECIRVGVHKRMTAIPAVVRAAPAFADHPVTDKIAIDPDYKEVLIFLPAHNQGSVTVQ